MCISIFLCKKEGCSMSILKIFLLKCQMNNFSCSTYTPKFKVYDTFDISTLSYASATAISRLVNIDLQAFNNVATIFEASTVKLRMDSSMITQSLMVLQTYLKEFPNADIEITTLAGISLGIKYITDGFYISDIFEHVTNFFTVKELETAEHNIFSVVQSISLQSLPRFRNGLLNVACESPHDNDDVKFTGTVLVLDDDVCIANKHKQMLEEFSANVYISHTVDAAKCLLRNNRIKIALLDLELFRSSNRIEDLVREDGSISFTNMIDSMYKTFSEYELTCKPLIIIVSNYGTELIKHAKESNEFNADGSFKKTDMIIQKPLTKDIIKTILQLADY